MRVIASLLAMVLAVPMVIGQTPPDIAASLRSDAKPIEAKDLPEDFRAVALGPTESIFGMYGFGMTAGGSDIRARIFLRAMGAIFVDPDQFAVIATNHSGIIRGYSVDITAMIAQNQGGSSGSVPPLLFSQTWISGAALTSWTPRPDLTKAAILAAFATTSEGDAAVAGSPQAASEATTALSNAKQLALGSIMYATDYDDYFAGGNSTREVAGKIEPYLKNNELWTAPNGSRFLYNVSLTGKSMNAIEEPAATILIWMENPLPDGRRAVAYVDGHAKLLDAEAWSKAWSAELARRKRR